MNLMNLKATRKMTTIMRIVTVLAKNCHEDL